MISGVELIELVKGFEGLRCKAYSDLGGVWTVGYGTTRAVLPAMEVTEEQACELLIEDLDKAEQSVLKLVKVPINKNQMMALTSWVYNLGAGALAGSTLLKKINAKLWDEAANEFLKWDHVGTNKVAGLTKRRKAERELFLRKVV